VGPGDREAAEHGGEREIVCRLIDGEATFKAIL